MKPELPLTLRQRELLAHLAHGLDTPEIADLWQLNERSVQNEVSRVIKALRVSNRAQAVAMFLRPRLDVREPGAVLVDLDRVPTYQSSDGCPSCGAPTAHVELQQEDRKLELHACEACMGAYLVET